MFGLLGPNGAGKSTTVKILTTLSRPEPGPRDGRRPSTSLRHPDAVRRAIGLVGQKASSDPMATGRENLVLAGRIQGMLARRRAARARRRPARPLRAADAAGRLAKTYSGGMARKLDVAIGLMHRPAVLFLDEPTTGSTPRRAREMWAEIGRLAAASRSPSCSPRTTSRRPTASPTGSRSSTTGGVVVEGTPEELKSELRGDTLRSSSPPRDAAPARRRCSPLRGAAQVAADGRGAAGPRRRRGARGARRARRARGRPASAVASVTVARPSLDDVYLRHAGRSFEVAA